MKRGANWIARLGLLVALSLVAHAQQKLQIPDYDSTDATRARAQSVLMASDIDALVNGIAGDAYVVSGCAVTAQGSPNMTVAVSAGAAYIAGALVTWSAGNATISAAHASQPRIDLVSINSSGTKVVTAGTPAATPHAPAIPSNNVTCGAVYVPATDTAIGSAQILSRRVLRKSDPAFGVNAQDYGAIPDFSTDSTAAIQAAIDAASASTYHRRVYLPGGGSGCYRVSAPLIIDDAYMEIVGDGKYQTSCIRTNGHHFPIFWVGKPFTDATYTTGLVGGGSAIVMPGADTGTRTWIDLANAGDAARLNGRSALTIEFYFKPTAVPSVTDPILGSYGTIGDGVGDQAFLMSVTSDQRWVGRFTINGSDCAVQSGTSAWVTNTTYHVSMVFNGSNVKLFYGTPGGSTTVAGTTSCSGTITQKPWEHMGVGTGRRSAWPHGGYITNSAEGVLDSIRFSNTARYTASFTAPNVKLATDSATLLLEVFDNETSRFSIIKARDNVDNNFANTWLPKEVGAQYPTQMSSVNFKGLELNAGQGAANIYLIGVTNSLFEDLWLRNGVFGIVGPADAYLNEFRRIDFLNENANGIGLAALALRASSGLTNVETSQFWAWPIAMLIDGGSIVSTNNYIHGENQVHPLVVRDASTATILGTSFSTEDTTTTGQISSVLLRDVHNASFAGTTFERLTTGSAGPAVQIHGGYAITFNGGFFNVQSGATQAIEILSAPAQPVTVYTSRKSYDAVPWSTSAWVRAYPPLIAGAPTIASGFGTSPSIAAGGTYQSMRINVGTGGSATAGVVTMPFPATTGWNCHVNNLTAAAAHVAYNTRQTASTTTTVTVENQTTSTGAAVAWAASNIVSLTGCEPY